MLIADTDYSVKVESDISSYKDLLLGVFFFGVGSKIDLAFFMENLPSIAGVFILVLLLKALVIYAIIRRNSDRNTAAKSALALAQVGEFSFAVFALAASDGLVDPQSASFLILVSVVSMILTPVIVSHIYTLSSYFEKEFYESDVITPIAKKEHIVIAGFSTLGRIVASDLHGRGIDFIIISDNLRHVLLARKLGYLAYFGHLNKLPVLESLKVDEAHAVILTMGDEQTKRLIAEAVREFSEEVMLVMKVDGAEERKRMRGISGVVYVDVNLEVSQQLVTEVTECPI
jgi:CPA2 family monovalent cation:H+ antiporter-2